MNRKHIQELLDKYFEGETSLKEEKELKDFFLHTTLLPEEWKSYRQLFVYFDTEGKRTMPSPQSESKKRNILWIAGIGLSLAASVFILLTVFNPSTTSDLKPYATATKQLDSGFVTDPTKSASTSEKPEKNSTSKSGKTKSVPPRSVLNSSRPTLLALQNDVAHHQSSLGETIDASLAPLDKMNLIDQALDKFKYFDLMNKYLPDQDLSSIIKTNP